MYNIECTVGTIYIATQTFQLGEGKELILGLLPWVLIDTKAHEKYLPLYFDLSHGELFGGRLFTRPCHDKTSGNR